ncbi:DNA-binding response regulator [Williamsia muralis]|uniref:Helix-turn-helix transcriptional regulator n=1 Tax=Williamsia marianensis TaxID=85044 RepID=A0A2G3PHQ6_WILMA|nr:response regulator transcription factor [Williamsia marianensis]PHV65347.1 helix-turn-helix transcriptional regulator [Williamsia marianensis]PZT94761.1 MAG: DNA-binding response regulator [Gordonia sp. (in: high G+C Gram-positive bacteria)]
MTEQSCDRERKIGVVEDFESQLTGLAAIINDSDGMTFAAGASTVDGLLSITKDLDLVILDLRLEDGSTPKSNVEQLHAAGIKVLVFTTADYPDLVRAATAAGVLGVVRKSVRNTELVEAIRSAADGNTVATMDWASAIDADPALSEVNLSPRQRQVLELYASGEPANRVASLTGLSTETVNVYLSRIRRKYADAGRPAPTKTDLYKRALEDGWLPIPRLFRR